MMPNPTERERVEAILREMADGFWHDPSEHMLSWLRPFAERLAHAEAELESQVARANIAEHDLSQLKAECARLRTDNRLYREALDEACRQISDLGFSADDYGGVDDLASCIHKLGDERNRLRECAKEWKEAADHLRAANIAGVPVGMQTPVQHERVERLERALVEFGEVYLQHRRLNHDGYEPILIESIGPLGDIARDLQARDGAGR